MRINEHMSSHMGRQYVEYTTERIGYKVDITPGRISYIDPVQLHDSLKDGCKEASKYHTNIYVYGRHGVGKTSVLKYFGLNSQELFGISEEDVVYMTAADFIDSVIFGIRNNTLPVFRAACERAKLIILDDIDILAEKENSQSELKLLLDSKKKFVFSGSRPVEDLSLADVISSRVSRFTIMRIEECIETVTEKCAIKSK